MKQVNDNRGQGWLLFFYSVPSKPVSNRMKIWRKLLKAGAVQLKGAVYIMPFNDENYEFLQWLVSEIAGMKGEGAFVKIEKVDTMKDEEIVTLFDRQRANDYKVIQKELEDIERRTSSIQKGTKTQSIKTISKQFSKLLKDFEGIKKIDFFLSKEGRTLDRKIKSVKTEIKDLSGAETKKQSPKEIITKAIDSYQGKKWVTRKKPFIDRMASAWLIRKFIDKKASFDFIDENDVQTLNKGTIAFDVRAGEFTHAGDLCTFEALIKSFGLKDKILKKMAEIVHNLDMKDEKYSAPEAKGLEDILSGIRKTAKNDTEALEKGMSVFEMLYVSKG